MTPISAPLSLFWNGIMITSLLNSLRQTLSWRFSKQAFRFQKIQGTRLSTSRLQEQLWSSAWTSNDFLVMRVKGSRELNFLWVDALIENRISDVSTAIHHNSFYYSCRVEAHSFLPFLPEVS